MQCETVSGGLQGNQLIIATAKKMYQQGAIRTSYRGLTMGLVGMFPYSAIDLGTFEFLKAHLVRYNAKVLGCHEEDALPGSFATGCIGAFSVSSSGELSPDLMLMVEGCLRRESRVSTQPSSNSSPGPRHCSPPSNIHWHLGCCTKDREE